MLYPNGLKTPPTVTDKYGWRIHPITGIRTFHYGVDSVDHPGGWNKAPEDGEVIFAGYNGGAGNQASIRSGDHVWKIFHHQRLDVGVAQRTPEGTITGPTGTTGASTGVHCHLELWFGSVSQDAFAYIAARVASTAALGSTQPSKRKKPTMSMIFIDSSKFDGAGNRTKSTPFAICGEYPGGGEANAWEFPKGSGDKFRKPNDPYYIAVNAGIPVFDLNSSEYPVKVAQFRAALATGK